MPPYFAAKAQRYPITELLVPVCQNTCEFSSLCANSCSTQMYVVLGTFTTPVFLILFNFSISQNYGKNMTERAFIITFNL